MTREQVQETCGWTVRFADALDETPPPTAARTGDAARPAGAHRPPPISGKRLTWLKPSSATTVRTPIGRFGGALSSVRADDLGAVPLKALMARNPGVDWAAVDDVIFGCANQAGEDNRNVARMALLLAGLPVGVSGHDRQPAVRLGHGRGDHRGPRHPAGEAELMIAGGVESMTRAPFVMPKAETAFSRNAEIYDTTIGWRFVNPLMKQQYGVDSMPETGENVAEDYQRQPRRPGRLRAAQPAARGRGASQRPAGREIVPVTIPQRKGDPVVVDTDEHPRADTTLEALAKLPTPFRQGGTVTAGNASGVNDGAAALIVASEAAAKRHGLTPIARILGGATAGVPPRIMGIGPVPATRKLCARLGLKPADFDVIELNEAFASQALAVLRELGIADDARARQRRTAARSRSAIRSACPARALPARRR